MSGNVRYGPVRPNADAPCAGKADIPSTGELKRDDTEDSSPGIMSSGRAGGIIGRRSGRRLNRH